MSKSIVFAALFVWGIPLSIFRSKFRKIVYDTDDWKINVMPWFTQEIKGLIGNLYPQNPAYIRFRNFYRFYLFVELVLFLFWQLL